MNSRSMVPPAQLTWMSMPPSSSPARAAIACAESQLVTSVRWATAPPPASAATWAARASSTSAMRTCAPSRANASTIPRPMLLAPPVTMTERPARPRSTALRLSDPAPASPEKAERAHADQPDQRPQTRTAALRDQGPGAFSRWRGGSRGSRARAPHLHRVEHRVELDAEHGDQAEEIGEGHEEKDQAERLAIGVGATGEAEVEGEQQRQELEEHAGHQRSGPDLAQLLAPVGYDVVNGAEEQAAGRHAEQQLEREGRRRIVQEARDEGQALHDGEEAGRDQADAGQDREEHDHRDADQDLAEEVAGPRLIDDGESRLHGVEEGRARPDQAGESHQEEDPALLVECLQGVQRLGAGRVVARDDGEDQRVDPCRLDAHEAQDEADRGRHHEDRREEREEGAPGDDDRPVGRLVGQELTDQTAWQALRQALEIHDSQGINLMTGSISFEQAAGYYDQTRVSSPELDLAISSLLAPELEPRGLCLEIGVGTGRIALPLSRAGVRMVGIDLSPAMLSRLVDKAGEDPFPVV